MPALYDIRLTDAIFQVGQPLDRLDGFGDDMFSLEPASDVGAAFKGALGDVMFMDIEMPLWTATLTFLTAGRAIDLLGALRATRAAFPVNVVYGNFSLVGFGKMINMGPVAAGIGATSRQMTMAIAKVSGNTDASPGTIIAVV